LNNTTGIGSHHQPGGRVDEAHLDRTSKNTIISYALMRSAAVSICLCKNQSRMIRLICLAGLACLAGACSSNKARQDTVGGGNNNNCTTTNVTYTNAVSSIISSNGCLGCHGSTPKAPFSLQRFDLVKAKASQSRNGNSVLYGAVAHLSGFVPMPQSGGQISACDQSKIKAWIDAGMPQ